MDGKVWMGSSMVRGDGEMLSLTSHKVFLFYRAFVFSLTFVQLYFSDTCELDFRWEGFNLFIISGSSHMPIYKTFWNQNSSANGKNIVDIYTFPSDLMDYNCSTMDLKCCRMSIFIRNSICPTHCMPCCLVSKLGLVVFFSLQNTSIWQLRLTLNVYGRFKLL